MERFGKFWGAFSVIDLFILNGLTIVTEFIGISLALGYFGVPRVWGIAVATGIVVAAVSTGSFPPVRAGLAGAVLLQLAAGAVVPDGASAAG